MEIISQICQLLIIAATFALACIVDFLMIIITQFLPLLFMLLVMLFQALAVMLMFPMGQLLLCVAIIWVGFLVCRGLFQLVKA